ncbi:major facilitator superfamily domain-containing protein 9-like isoform X2 [Choristoneura fumiferana]
MVIPLVSSHVQALGGNHVYVGLMGSMYSGFQLGSGPLIGSLSDLKGRKNILIATLLISSISYTSMGLTSSITVILITRAVLGLFKQTQVLTRALVPDYEKNENKQSIIYGKMAAISGAGITVGPVIGGHLAEDHPEEAFAFIGVVVGICFVLNAGLVYLLPNTNSVRREPTRVTNISSSILQKLVSSCKESIIELCKIEWSKYWDVFFFKGLVGFAMAAYYSNYALYLKSTYDLTPKYIGYIISFQGVIGSVSSYFIGYINSFYKTDTDYSQRNFHVFFILTLSVLGLIFSFNIYMYAFFLIPLATCTAVGRLVTLEMVLKRGHGEHRGTLIGASNSVRSVSGVIAPMAAGVIGQYFGVQRVIYMSLFAALIGTTLSYFKYRNKGTKIE